MHLAHSCSSRRKGAAASCAGVHGEAPSMLQLLLLPHLLLLLGPCLQSLLCGSCGRALMLLRLSLRLLHVPAAVLR